MRKWLLAVSVAGLMAVSSLPAQAGASGIDHIQLGPRVGVFSPTEARYHVGAFCSTDLQWQMDVTLNQGTLEQTRTTPWRNCHGLTQHSGFRPLIYDAGFVVGVNGTASGFTRTRLKSNHAPAPFTATDSRTVRFIQCPCE